MKKKEIKDLASKSNDELDLMLKQLKSELSKLRMDSIAGKLKNIASIGEKRKDMARILTFRRKNELAK